jgi:hypothetical protein
MGFYRMVNALERAGATGAIRDAWKKYEFQRRSGVFNFRQASTTV